MSANLAMLPCVNSSQSRTFAGARSVAAAALRFIADQSRARCGEGGLIGLVVIGRHEFGNRPGGAKQKEEGGERDADGRHQDGQLLAERCVLDVKLARPLVSFKDRRYKVKKQRKPGRRQSSRSTASHAL
jgi:hypothetical protein